MLRLILTWHKELLRLILLKKLKQMRKMKKARNLLHIARNYLHHLRKTSKINLHRKKKLQIEKNSNIQSFQIIQLQKLGTLNNSKHI